MAAREELAKIIEKARQGVSSKDLQPLIKALFEKYPDLRDTPGEYGSLFREVLEESGGLGQQELGELMQAENAATPEEFETQIGLLGSLALGGATTRAGAAAAGGIVAKGIGKVIGGVGKKFAKHPLGYSLLGGVVASGVAASTGEDLGTTITPGDPNSFQPDRKTGGLSPDERGATFVVDRDGSLSGVPGSLVQQQTTPTGGVINLSPELSAAAQSLGIDPSILAQLQGFNQPKLGLDPEAVGLTQTGAPLQLDYRENQSTTKVADRAEAQVKPITQTVPTGAILANRSQQVYNGKTLLQWAGEIASQWGVPLSVLYGLVTLESGWDINAVGDNGTSHGLVQIHQPAFPNISPVQARNPIFALSFAARSLATRYRQWGSWEAAVAAHNSPVAAQHLAKTGKFYNEKSMQYVSTVMDYAQKSQLSSNLFDPGNFVPEDGFGAGPSRPPLVLPDPAKLRAYVKSIYKDLLKRDPDDTEVKSGVDKLNGFFRLQYDRNAVDQGGEDVDPSARFQESIEATGEYQYRQDVEETRSMTDYLSGIARMLQAGI